MNTNTTHGSIVAPHQQYAMLKVWLPGTLPGRDAELLILQNPWSLQFFLEALYHGHTLFGVRPFQIIGYQIDAIEHVCCHVSFVDVGDPATFDDSEPVKLRIERASGELASVLQDAWRIMLARVAEDDEGTIEPDQEKT
jgi:hypothetical protein